MTNYGEPTPPIEIVGGAAAASARLDTTRVELDPSQLASLAECCTDVSVEPAELTEASRDWWPLAQVWATEGKVPTVASALARPVTIDEVRAVVSWCNDERVPLTVAAGRSGVCGASVPLHGGVVLDMCALSGIRSIDHDSMVLDVGPGTFGDVLEDELAERGLTVGHWPQSVQLSTVGGWVACRGAGQLSNRYGKIENMVVGLDVVLADGSLIHTGGHARAAAGPDLDQLFIGSEGTLGVIVGVRLRLHHLESEPIDRAYGFASFAEANDACRHILQRGVSPAVLRVYDAFEAGTRYDTGDLAVLLVRELGDSAIADAVIGVVDDECADAEHLDDGLVATWWGHRNDVSALESLTNNGFGVDTMEITVAWGRVGQVYDSVCEAIGGIEGTRLVSAHQSHAYLDGACIYFTFVTRPEDPADRERWYVEAWDAGTRTALSHGASLSHHHGGGLNRSRIRPEALDGGHAVLASIKTALDPAGILNPGKLGLADPFGDPAWP
jgi:alkyldihydroxyacetonephosphate synthase